MGKCFGVMRVCGAKTPLGGACLGGFGAVAECVAGIRLSHLRYFAVFSALRGLDERGTSCANSQRGDDWFAPFLPPISRMAQGLASARWRVYGT